MWTLMLVIFVASGASTGGVGATTTFLDFPDEAKCRTAAEAIAGADQIGLNRPGQLIDVNEPLDPNEPIPQDKAHLHFGAGQTEAHIELAPGKHTLQLVLGDAKHFPFNPPIISKKITITVK
jgi:hypothetical protein